MKNKFLFYFLTFTWGLPMTLAGGLAALVLLLSGHKAKRWRWGWYFEAGKDWGGVSLGPVFIVDDDSNEFIRDHEFGHALQNCALGPFMPLLVSLPSAARWWYFRWLGKRGRRAPRGYYDIWFESGANKMAARSRLGGRS